MIIALFILISVTYIFVKSLSLESIQIKRQSPNSQALELINFLIESSSFETCKKAVPTYKFYSRLVEELFEFRNRFGSEIRTSLKEIRKSLSLEIRENKKIKEAVMGGYFQYFSMCSFIWGFLFMAQNLIDAQIETKDLVLVFFWQVLGCVLLVTVIRKRKHVLFEPFDQYFMYLYRFKTMLRTSRPLDEILKSFQKDKNDKSFSMIDERVNILCVQIKKRGKVDLEEVDHLLQELWDHFELQFSKFSTNLVALKLASLVIFVLPSFFISLFVIFGSLKVFE